MTGSSSPADAISELDPGARLGVRIAGLIAGLMVAALLALTGGGLRQSLFDLFQNITPTPDVSRRVHVVVIDADSLRELGGWPWSRFYLARLIEQITDRGALAIGVDLLLPEPDRFEPTQFTSLYAELPPTLAADIRKLPSMDAVLARVIGRSPVVLARAGVRQGSFDYVDHAAAALPPEARFAGDLPRNVLAFPRVVANLPILDGAPLGHGLVNGDRDADGVVRRVPVVARAAGKVTPGFALELVRVADGATRIELEGQDGRLDAVRIGKRRVPTTPDGQLELRFGDWRRIQTTSAVNVLRKGLPGDAFKNQIVLIGLTSAGASDATNTPRARAVYSVFVQAQAVDAVLRGAGLSRPVWVAPTEWGLGLGLMLVAWLGVPRLPMSVVGVVSAALIGAAFGASWLAFSQDLLIDPYPVLAPGAAASAVMIVLLLTQTRRARARLEIALENQRRRSEEHQGLLMDELNHRVNNTLATVLSIAMQTSRNTRDPGQFVGDLMARIRALALAHELLSEATWDGASLAEVINRTLAPYITGDDGDRVRLSGPPLSLSPNAAVTLNMAFHELATNAAKYGALSVGGGRVDVRWSVDPAGNTLTIVWRETAGPPVAEPAHRGFGSRLIEQGVAREFEGEVNLMFTREGVCCRMILPLSAKMRVAT